MTRRTLPPALLLLLAWVAIAQAQAPESARPVDVSISERQCRALVAHSPADGVAYRPGRDVHGRAVTPADLDGSPAVPALSAITVPLTLSLADVIPLPRGIDADIPLWAVTVAADGRTYINGQPLHDEAALRLAEACRERFGL